MLQDPGKFLDSLINYDRDNIPDSIIAKIKPYIESESFLPAAVAKVSKACTSICLWVRAMYKYHHVAKTVAPYRQALQSSELELAETEKILAEARERLNACEERIANLQAKYDDCIRKQHELEEKSQLFSDDDYWMNIEFYLLVVCIKVKNLLIQHQSGFQIVCGGNVLNLSSLPKFANLPESITQNRDGFKKIFDSCEPHRSEISEPWQTDLDSFQRILVLRCLTADKVTNAMQDFVSHHLGQRFFEPQTTSLHQVFKDSSPSAPLIFVFSQNDVFMHLFLSLAFFHSILIERKKFGPLGFNIPYEFTTGDLRICMDQLIMFLTEYTYYALQAGHINYGGRITDDWDRRCAMSILDEYYFPRVLEDDYSYSPSGILSPATRKYRSCSALELKHCNKNNTVALSHWLNSQQARLTT
uniref:Dynein heavy chain coiled coil stalk domain-containing protein n=1 Tax=Trichobilharzia regenti TaxID=157069 RepID=A0AA85K9P7_TRIRE|nr:unnamed protein product [Trichobilharzia regenti]